MKKDEITRKEEDNLDPEGILGLMLGIGAIGIFVFVALLVSAIIGS